MFIPENLIDTKINTPNSKMKIVKRTELFSKLNGIIDYRLCLVISPAGFGKTTLLTSWIKSLPRSKPFFCWISLDEFDNDLDMFWSYFLASLSKGIPQVMNSIENYYTLHNADVNRYISIIVNLVNTLDEHLIVILDDFQCINNNEIIRSINLLLKYIPDKMNLIISSRVIPNIDTARLIASEGLMLIGQSELAFNEIETKELFDNAKAEFLKDKIIYFKCLSF